MHPFKDDKVMTDWNGLMIAALAKAARAFGEPRYEQAARRAADYLLSELRTRDGSLRKLSRGGVVAGTGMVEDYSFAIWGLIELYESCFELSYLRAALELQELQLARFWDGDQGGFFISPADAEELIVRPKDAYDGAIPSGNSVAAQNLLRLARLSGRSEFEERSSELMQAFSGQIIGSPSNYSQMMLALDVAVGSTHELVIAAGEDEAQCDEALERIGGLYAPHLVVLLIPDQGGEEMGKLAPFAAEQRARGGRTTFYLCQDFSCQAPTHDLEAVLKQLQ